MKIPANQTHVGQTAYPHKDMAMTADAAAYQICSVHRPTAVQNVQSTMNVHWTRLVSAASARILVLDCVELMRNAASEIMCQSVSVLKTIKEIHSRSVILLQLPLQDQKSLILATHHLVESMHNVESATMQLLVLVYLACSAIPTLNVSQNVPSTKNVLPI